MKKLIGGLLSSLGYEVSRKDVVWRPWSEGTALDADHEFANVFQHAYDTRSKYTRIPGGTPSYWSKPVRAYVLKEILLSLTPLAHDVAECGVYRGGTAFVSSYFLRKSGFGNRFWLFDSFEGLPSGDAKVDPWYQKGEFGDTSVDLVRDRLKEFSFVSIVKGWIPDSLESAKNCKFSFVHIDVDHYQSTMDCCSFFFPRLVAPGAMVFDDYGTGATPGSKKAVDEYFSKAGVRPIYLPSGQAVVFRYR